MDNGTRTAVGPKRVTGTDSENKKGKNGGRDVMLLNGFSQRLRDPVPRALDTSAASMQSIGSSAHLPP